MKSLKQVYEINSPVEKVWDALVNTDSINNWGAGDAIMSDTPGSEFSLWNGDIWGKNKTVEKYKLLVQDWYAGKWTEPSIVTFRLSSSDDNTTVELEHTNIPDNEFDDIETGWRDYYMNPLKEYVEAK